MGILGWQGLGNKNIPTVLFIYLFILSLQKEEIKAELAN